MMTVDAAGKGFSLPSGPATLCFDKEEFMKLGFEVDKFIVECRKKVPLETLRDDLGMYLKVVRSAMIELINKDYADFVNLSTNLVGMDKAITSLTTPLGQLKEEVLSVQTAMDLAIQAVEEKIKQQQEIMRKKAVLQRLMNITHSVEKIEKLLGIHAASEGDHSPGQLTGPLIERVATEFNKLQFYVTRSKGHPLVDKVKPRIAAITTTLQYSLEGSFLSGLESGKAGMLRQCLRTYALIDKTQDAENLFREHVVRPYMEDIITEDFLAQHDYDVAAMYKEVLAFVPDKCSVLSSITTGTSGGDIVRGYDFVVNAVFPEIVSCMEIRTSSIFAPGNPDTFHKKYTACMQFLDSFERQCGSQASVQCLRQHPSYVALLSKWSLPVYFQIRFQDIATSFETSLCYGFSNSSGSSDFRLNSTAMLWRCLGQCWEDEVYLQALLHRFVKLNMQLLSRFKTWLDDIYQEELTRKIDATSDMKQRSSTPDRLRSSPSFEASARSTSPVPKAASSSSSPLTDSSTQQPPMTLGQIVAVMADIDSLSHKVSQLFETSIRPKLVDIGFENAESVMDVLMGCVSVICDCRPRFWSMVTEDIVRQCSGSLTQVNDIPRLYRRTNKEVPTKPSAYLVGVMKPLTRFCEEHASALSDQQKQEFLSHVFSALAQQFCEVTSEVLVSTKKMEDSLRRLKKARGTDKEKERSGGVTDSDKIRTQIIIDIDSFTSQVESLGLKVSEAKGHSRLAGLAQDAKTDITSASLA